MSKTLKAIDVKETARIKRTLETLILWMAQSTNSPIAYTEAQKLLQMLKGDDD